MKTPTKINQTILGAGLAVFLAAGSLINATAQTTARIVFQAQVTTTTGGHKPSSATHNQLFAMNPDGTGVIQLTTAAANSQNPAWSPGQQYISFYRNGMLYVMAAVGEANGAIPFAVSSATTYGADWSPDSSSLCFLRTNGIWTVSINAATGAVGTPVHLRAGECYYPTWSPDGTRIAFCTSDDGGYTQVVKVLDLSTGAEASFGVGPVGSYNFSPTWSPDATQIAFSGPIVTITTARNGKQTTTTYNELFVANADGTGITQLTNFKTFSTFPTWSPDGSAIAFRSDYTGTTSIHKMTLSTGAVTLLRSGANCPNWN